MGYKEYDVVSNINPVGNVPAGTEGLIQMVFKDGEAYAIEFFDSNDNTIGVEVLKHEELKFERPSYKPDV